MGPGDETAQHITAQFRTEHFKLHSMLMCVRGDTFHQPEHATMLNYCNRTRIMICEKCNAYPRSKTHSSVLPLSSLLSASASSESTGISAPICRIRWSKAVYTTQLYSIHTITSCLTQGTWPDVITISPLASSRLSAMIVPCE
jgi:hypothetical protein